MGKTDQAGVPGGLGGVASAAGNAALSPLRRATSRATDSLKSSFAEGRRGSVAATGGSFYGDTDAASGAAPDATTAASSTASAEGPPAWAQRMKRGGHMGHGASAAAHAVRSGDGHGSGASVNLSESDRS
jgi:type IV secretion system protein TrbL